MVHAHLVLLNGSPLFPFDIVTHVYKSAKLQFAFSSGSSFSFSVGGAMRLCHMSNRSMDKKKLFVVDFSRFLSPASSFSLNETKFFPSVEFHR